jgi:cAMP phosphodiesterase
MQEVLKSYVFNVLIFPLFRNASTRDQIKPKPIKAMKVNYYQCETCGSIE